MDTNDAGKVALTAPVVRPTPATPDDPLLGTVIGERYRVESVLGTGGMGTVYLAEHVLMEKVVALKVLHPTLAVVGSVMERFKREAIALSRIEHPNVVSATDFGKLKNGAYYLTLEYVEGQSLAALLEQGALPLERALRIGLQIARALSAAHQQGIVHRDLKPHNVMLTHSPTVEQAKVLDFGLAKLRSKSGEGPSTRAGSVFGTPQYMAPEQVSGVDVDHRADLYALGLLLYEMLAGKPPFNADSVREVLDLQVNAHAEPLPAEVPSEIRELIDGLLRKSPEERPQSADEVIPKLEALVEPQREHASLRAWLNKTAAIGPLSVPIWGLVLPGVVFLGLFVLGLWQAASESRAIGAVTPPEPDRWPELMADAEFGDPAALAELQAIPPKERGNEIWAILAKGHLANKDTDKALDVFRLAIHTNPELSEDENIAIQVASAVGSDKFGQKAVTVAAESLGSRGADILFFAWAGTKERTPESALAQRYLSDEAVLKKASNAVKLALSLRSETECQVLRGLVEDAKNIGDNRSVRPMSKMRKKTGCGTAGKDDCFPCLRNDSLLDEAIAAASKRKGPRY